MNTTFDIRGNCVRIKADIRGRGMVFRGSGIIYPLGADAGYDYVLTAQHILKDGKKDLASVIDKVSSIEFELFDNGSFQTYQTIEKEKIARSLLLVGNDFLIIKIDRCDKQFTPFMLADDLIEEKPMHLYGVSREAQDLITRLDCRCVDKNVNVINITSAVDKMESLHGMSGGCVFAMNQPLMYGVLWKQVATDGEFHNVKISQALEDQIEKGLKERNWKGVKFINVTRCKQAMSDVYKKEFQDINDSILIENKMAGFPLEDRFIVPDFVSTVPNVSFSNFTKENLKGVPPVSIYRNGSDIREFSEQYMRDFYGQLNETSNREVRRPATSVLNPERKILLVLGGPGSGKSSLLKHLTLQVLQGSLDAYDGYLPVWMPFSFMARNSESDIKEIVRSWFQEHNLWDKYSYYLEYAFVQRKILLIADGIDEWGDESLQADRIIRKVKAETETENLIAIFSSREYGIANINSTFGENDSYTIAPLSAAQQDELIRKCIDHYNVLFQDTQYTAEFLSAKLRLLRDVDRMKENPMLLTVLIGQYLQGNELPHNNIAAMECVMEQLFVKHQQSRMYQAYDYSKSFDYTSNKMLLGVLSKEMFDYYNDGCMDKTQAVTLLNQYLNGQASGQELRNAHLVDDLMSHDTHKLGVIEERTGSRISFINRQLQEYMTAKYLSLDEERAKKFINERSAIVVFHQVALFLFEMMPASAFLRLYDVLKAIKTNDYRDYYLYKLKLEVLVRSVKAPADYVLCEVDEYIQKIENESDYDIKHDLLEILLDGFYNPVLENRVKEFVSRYIPSTSVFHDVRLSGLMQVSSLSEEERLFVIRAVINGEINNKILASNVIKKNVVSDKELLRLVNSYITPSTMPEVVAFFIRSVIVEGVDIEKENELVQCIKPCEKYTSFYQMEFSLFKGDLVEVTDCLDVISELPFSYNKEAVRVLLTYYAQDETVREKALQAVNNPFMKRGQMDKDIAWKYLLTCWIDNTDVINAISEQLKGEFPFNYGNGFELWDEIQKHKLPPELQQVITEWAVSNYDKNSWRAEGLVINTIAKDPRIKEKLLNTLNTQNSVLHLIVHPLVKSWGDDDEVVAILQRFLDTEPLTKSSWMAEYAYDIFKGDDTRVIAFLDRCLDDENPKLQKDRAALLYISHYKEIFADKYIHRILNDEIRLSNHLLGSKWNILQAILDQYSDRQDVKDYFQKYYSDDNRFAGLIIAKYHTTQLASKMLCKWHHFDARLRLMMIHKISNLSSIDESVEAILHSFQQEGNNYVLSDMVLCLVEHLKRKGRDNDVFKIADEVFQTTQVTMDCAYKVRFCIYLTYHKLDEYLKLEIGEHTKEYQYIQMGGFYDDSPYAERTIAKEADFLLANDMANLKKIFDNDKTIYSFVVFFSKHVNPASESAKIITKYIADNKDSNKEIITDPNILLFLKKVEGQKPLLRDMIIANIDNDNSEMTAALAQIIASDFDNDDEIEQLLLLDNWKDYNISLNRISLNCSLNTDIKKIKEIYGRYKADDYSYDGNYATYNFIFSAADVNDVLKNLKYYLTDLFNFYVYRMIITPLVTRLKRDKELFDKMYEELLVTDDPRIKVGFYSLLSSLGEKTIELKEWRSHQNDHLYEYGHDIVTNRDRLLLVSMQN